MTREWAPGDVAMVTRNRDGVAVVAMRVDHEPAWRAGQDLLGSAAVSAARPLVVIDPEDREQATATMWAYRLAYFGQAAEVPAPAVVDAWQAALRSLLTPPKPKPKVNRHLATVASGGRATALCGKVWQPGGDVEVVEDCPECKALAGNGWLA